MNSGNNLGKWLVSSPARGTYNSITCSLTANYIVPPICGPLEQNHEHGWLALPRGFLPPLMTFKTSILQKYFHLNKPLGLTLACQMNLEASVRCVDSDLCWKFPKCPVGCVLKCSLKSRLPRLKVSSREVGSCILAVCSWRLMVYPNFKVPSKPEHMFCFSSASLDIA